LSRVKTAAATRRVISRTALAAVQCVVHSQPGLAPYG
jgi:hypothetical protein